MAVAMKKSFDNFKSIRWGEVFAIVGILLSLGACSLTRVDRKFDKLESTLERIERDNRDFHGRLSHLEGKNEVKEN